MYQFVHIETFARKSSTKVKPTKKKAATVSTVDETMPKGMDAFIQPNGTVKPGKTKSTMDDVLAEALRDEGHCSHVAVPKDPVFLIGDEAALRALPSEIERNIEAYKAKNGGRKLRSDAHVLLAGVASYPRALAAADPKAHQRWEIATLRWLREKYGDDLRVVLRHEDEPHPHIHFFVLSRQRVDAKELHDGYVATVGMPPLSKETTAAYRNAMRDFQSDYYERVGHAAGLLRDGPKRKRMDRATYKAIQREERERVALSIGIFEAQAAILDNASQDAKRAADLRRDAERGVCAIVMERTELSELRDDAKRTVVALDAEWAKAKARLTELNEREENLANGENDLAGRLMNFNLQSLHIEHLKKSAATWESSARRTLERADERLREAEKCLQTFRAARGSLFNAQELATLAHKPELAGMLEFVAHSQDAKDLLNLMKQDPQMVEYVRNAVLVADSLSDGLQNADWASESVDWSAVLATTEAAEQPKANKRDSGLDFGL